MSATTTQPREADRRRAHRIVVDLLATEDQLLALQDAIGAALCGAPAGHAGSCRVAWSMASATGDPTTGHPAAGDPAGAAALDPSDTWSILVELSPVEVWPPADVDRSLGLRAP